MLSSIKKICIYATSLPFVNTAVKTGNSIVSFHEGLTEHVTRKSGEFPDTFHCHCSFISSLFYIYSFPVSSSNSEWLIVLILFPWSGILKIGKPEDSEDLQFEIDEESQKLHQKKACDKGTTCFIRRRYF